MLHARTIFPPTASIQRLFTYKMLYEAFLDVPKDYNYVFIIFDVPNGLVDWKCPLWNDAQLCQYKKARIIWMLFFPSFFLFLSCFFFLLNGVGYKGTICFHHHVLEHLFPTYDCSQLSWCLETSDGHTMTSNAERMGRGDTNAALNTTQSSFEYFSRFYFYQHSEFVKSCKICKRLSWG